jgi:hypothetical protein
LRNSPRQQLGIAYGGTGGLLYIRKSIPPLGGGLEARQQAQQALLPPLEFPTTPSISSNQEHRELGGKVGWTVGEEGREGVEDNHRDEEAHQG